MHKKNNSNKSKNFIQGLRPFATSIPRGLKTILKKNGYNYSSIIDNWTKMVGKNIASKCYPIKIKLDKINKNTLILNVIHGKEIEVEYEKKNIVDKINFFLGYNFINKINLKTIREKKMLHKDKKIITKNIENFEKKIKNFKNSNLKSSLNKFLKAYNEKKN
ncbi:MAG: DUF721 domain-containing protein [Candidatus Pelagibacter sp. TMED165]|nr:MAG: DUF721 domain-containing protein [Candidatus Pelagibacter sp. TMED165]|tara:strand:+ start:248 stop:733 length:486 start_codon:yes stop_codon:yes gene_type:complete